MSGIVIILDGLGDLPIPSLGGKTPLEAATTPILDQLAASGRYGLVDPIGPGITPNTHSGTGVILGMAPVEIGRLQRGPVEAAGAGLNLAPGDIALRANFASLATNGDEIQVLDRRAGRINDGVEQLADALQAVDLSAGVTATLRATDEHRGVLVLRGPGLHPAISDTDPGGNALPTPVIPCKALQPAAEHTASLVNRFVRAAHEVLRDHPLNVRRVSKGQLPANGVLTRGAGTATTIENVIRDAGMQASVISGCNTVKGLGRMFGFDVVSDDRFTGDLDTDLGAKIDCALSHVRNNRLVFIHIKAPDICAHDRRPMDKKNFLEKVDHALAPLAALPIVIAVAADHTTDSNTGLHTEDPVPALISSPNGAAAAATINFGESGCRDGNLPRQTSAEFMRKVIQAAQ